MSTKKRFFTSADCCVLCDQLKDYSITAKIGLPDTKLVNTIAHGIKKMQKEENRICKEHKESTVGTDSIKTLKKFIKEETHNALVYVETKGMDFFDYERFELI